MYFDYALTAFAVYYAVKESQYDYSDGLPRLIKQLSLIISMFFSALSVFHNFKWTIYNRIAFVLFFFIPLYLRIAYNSNVLGSTLLIMAAYNIPFSHITKACIRAVSLVFFIILFSLALGLVEDRLYYRDVDGFEKNYAHDLGFKYYSFYSYLAMGVVQCCIYLWRNKLNASRILFLVLFSFVFFQLSSTRLQLYACVTFIASILIIPFVPKKIFHNKWLCFIGVISYPLICIILYYVSKYAILSLFYSGYDELNKAMSGRLALNEEAFMRYDANLWGNNLDLHTSPLRVDYFYIDSGYLHVLLGDGVVFISLILILYMLLTYKVYKARAYYLYLWIVIYAILNISNGFLVSLLANPILLLAFSETESIRYDYYLTANRPIRDESAIQLV